MSDISTGTLLLILLALLLASAFFSAAETSMMAVNRYRLRHLAATGHRGAQRTSQLLAHTDQLLGVILLGNNLINTSSATLATLISIRLFGNHNWALGLATLAVTFAILIVSEITPKVMGAAYAEKIAFFSSLILRPLLSLARPIVWFVNLFVRALLRLLRLNPNQAAESHGLNLQELRTAVMDSGKMIAGTHKRALLNLLDLEDATVNDIMTPRNQIEAIDMDDDPDNITRQIISSHHTRLPVFRSKLTEIAGVVHIRALARPLQNGNIDQEILLEHLQSVSYIPSGTPLFTQLRQFQLGHHTFGLVVDEYGELLGLLTLQDILEELVGELDYNNPAAMPGVVAQEDGSWLVEGGTAIRHLNRRLGLTLPEDGPNTINGLVLEHLEAIPETGTVVKIADYPIEIIQVQERLIRTARIFPRITATRSARPAT